MFEHGSPAVEAPRLHPLGFTHAAKLVNPVLDQGWIGRKYFMNCLVLVVVTFLLVLTQSIVRAQEVETEKPLELLSNLALTEKSFFFKSPEISH